MNETVATIELDAIEARLLGCLIEKAALTPEAYPLTVNALVVAANQKTSREPPMTLEPGAVEHTLRQLEDRHLVEVVLGARAQRYAHRLDQAWRCTRQQLALLALLLLRGPQTVPELKLRCERLAGFDDLDALRQTLERLAQREPAMACNIGRGAGQREDRWMHLLCGPVEVHPPIDAGQAHDLSPTKRAPDRYDELLGRIDALEARLLELEQRRG